MKIALVNNFGPKTGIGKYAFNLFEQCRKKTEMEMVYLESKDNKTGEIDGIRKIRQQINLPVLNKSYSWYFFFPPRIPAGYSLYHLSSQYLARIARFREPCVITHMDIAPLVFPKEYPWVTRFLLKKAISNYGRMKKIITISDATKKELLESGLFNDEEKITVIPPGYDERIFRRQDKKSARKALGLPEDKKIILNIGSEEPKKNVPRVLETFRELQKENEDVLLVRIGNRNPEYDPLKKGLNLLELNNVPEEKLPQYYNAADVFVFPAIHPVGFAYPPIEAMACGTPAVVGGELEAFGKGAQVVDGSSTQEVLKAVKEIVFNDAKAKNWSKKAIDAAKEFTLEEEVKKTLAVYRDALS